MAELKGQGSECGVLDRLVDAVRAGESRALVVRGEPGIGKTVLLEYLAGRAAGCRVARAAGVQPEMELAFSGLHQVCATMLDRLERPRRPVELCDGTVRWRIRTQLSRHEDGTDAAAEVVPSRHRGAAP